MYQCTTDNGRRKIQKQYKNIMSENKKTFNKHNCILTTQVLSPKG
jgi:hypothetical protein